MGWYKDFEFIVAGTSDSDYAKDPFTRRSVSGYRTTLCGMPITEKSKMQNCVATSVTEAEAVSAVMCAQDMLFIKNVLESMELKVRLPIMLWCDNQGAVDLFNGWGVAGCTRHMAVRLNFIQELKEESILEVRWIRMHDKCGRYVHKELGIG